MKFESEPQIGAQACFKIWKFEMKPMQTNNQISDLFQSPTEIPPPRPRPSQTSFRKQRNEEPDPLILFPAKIFTYKIIENKQSYDSQLVIF